VRSGIFGKRCRSILCGGNWKHATGPHHYLERKWGVFFRKGNRCAARAGEAVRRSRRELIIDAADIGAVGGYHAYSVATAGAETFDVVVSNADIHHTYQPLHPVADRRTRRLERCDWSIRSSSFDEACA
jgi:phytoene desaturase